MAHAARLCVLCCAIWLPVHGRELQAPQAPAPQLAGPSSRRSCPQAPPFPNALQPAHGDRPIGIERFIPSKPEALPPFLDDLDRASAIEANRRTRAYWTSLPADREVAIGDRRYRASELLRGLESLGRLLEASGDPDVLRRSILETFDVFQSVAEDGRPEGTITGYYEPEMPIQAARGPGLFPLYARPPELEQVDSGLGLPFDYGHRDPRGGLIPYFRRDEIGAGILAGRGLELYWTRHPTDLYVLQVQGSGIGILPGGARRRLAFDGANGHPFRSVGAALVDCGIIPPGTDSLDILRHLRSQTPEREAELIDLNPRYTFLRSGPEDAGPTGATGVALVAGRSIAVDPRNVPLGMPALLFSRRPVADGSGRIIEHRHFARLVFSHDVGSAIRGPVRVDLFWGPGLRAAWEAHRMFAPGRLYLLLPKRRGAVDG